MHPQPKTSVAINNVSLTNAATGTGDIDTLGFDYVVLDVIMSTSNAVTNKPSVLKISESDITDATGFADIAALVAGGAGGFVNPNVLTQGANAYKFLIDKVKGKRKRYLKVTVSPVTTQVVTAVGNLYRRGEGAPTTAALAGTLALVTA